MLYVSTNPEYRKLLWKQNELRTGVFFNPFKKSLVEYFQKESDKVYKLYIVNGIFNNVISSNRFILFNTLQQNWKLIFTKFGIEQAEELNGIVSGSETKSNNWVYDPWSPDANKTISGYLEKFVKLIEKTTRKRLAKLIKKGIIEKKSHEDIGKDIIEEYQGWEEWRASLIARSSINSAANYAKYYAGWNSGLNLAKIWISQRDDRVRESHQNVDGETVTGINKFFSNGLLYPGDPSGSIEQVVNCRCYLRLEII